ncbi:MAG: 50S ribosomal protein L9, partial [Anaerolineae bacterium]|nr:50S ribosomal protein L9 [Anaerolineae bacterium]
DVVQVADGFARNYLIPRGLAIKASAGALREHQQLLKNVAIRRDELHQREQEAANRINGVELVFGVKAGKNGKLYGSITTMDIAQALEEKTGVDINRRRISERPLRELGVHPVPVRLGGGISPELRVVVIREEEIADYEAGKPVASLRGLGGRFEAAEEVVDGSASTEPVDVADDTAATSELEDEEAQAAE